MVNKNIRYRKGQSMTVRVFEGENKSKSKNCKDRKENHRYPSVAANTNPAGTRNKGRDNKGEIGAARGAEFEVLEMAPDGSEARGVDVLVGTELIAVLKPDVESCPTMLVLVIALLDR
jgi:hypothetical protein